MRTKGWVLGLWALGLLLGCPEAETVDGGGGADRAGAADAGAADTTSGADGSGGDGATGDLGATDQGQPDSWVLACPGDDAYEPNDSAGEAAALGHPGPVADTISCDAEDWYAITVPATFGMGVRLELSASNPDLDLYYYLASDPATPVDRSVGDHTLETVFGERFEQDTPVLIRVVNNDSPTTTSYRLLITFYQNGTCASDTTLEPNDEAASAAPLSVPVADLALHACDEFDWYAFTVPADNGLRAELRHTPAEANLAFGLFLASAPDSPVLERSEYAPRKELSEEIYRSATDVLLRVRNLAYPGPRGNYSLTVELHPGGYCVDDGHEPNDDAGSAAAISGLVAGVLCRDNVDVYSFTVAEPGPRSRVVVGHPGYDLEVELAEAGGGNLGVTTVDSATGSTKIEFTSSAGTTYLLTLRKAAGETAVAARYSIRELKGTPPDNDSCASATVHGGGELSGTTVNGYDDVAFAADQSSCVGHDSDGADVFYRVSVPAGQQLTAKLTSRANLALHLVDACASRCCFAGVDAEPGDPLNDVIETLVWPNATGQAQELYLAVDSRSPDIEGPFTLEVSLGAGGSPDGGATACTPDQAADAGPGDAAGEDL